MSDICNKCGKMIEDDWSKIIYAEGTYHAECFDKLIEEEK